MRCLRMLLHYIGFVRKDAMIRKDAMVKSEDFMPTNILRHRYQDPVVLKAYVKTLPANFADDEIQVKVYHGPLFCNTYRQI